MTKEWFLDWFGQEYLNLYAHRNDEEAERQVSFLLEILNEKPSKVLDIACGRARHLIAFAKLGIQGTGIDMSQPALDIAKERIGELNLPVELIHGDMRKVPVDDQSFPLLISMFTSFGYFETDQEHLDLLTEWGRCLSSQGTLIIDYLNRPQVLKNLVPKTVDNKAAKIITQNRSLSSDGRRVNKEIIIENTETGESKTFNESVRMYEKKQLLDLLEQADFHVKATYGDFDNSPHSDDSKRLLVVAEKK